MRHHQWHLRWHFIHIFMLKISLLSQFPAYFRLSFFSFIPSRSPLYMSLPHLFPVFRGQWTHINFIFSSMSRFNFDWRFFLLFHSFDFLFLRFECKFFFVILFSGKKWEQANKYEREQLFVAIGTSFVLVFFSLFLSLQCIDFCSISLSFDCWLAAVVDRNEMKRLWHIKYFLIFLFTNFFFACFEKDFLNVLDIDKFAVFTNLFSFSGYLCFMCAVNGWSAGDQVVLFMGFLVYYILITILMIYYAVLNQKLCLFSWIVTQLKTTSLNVNDFISDSNFKFFITESMQISMDSIHHYIYFLRTFHKNLVTELNKNISFFPLHCALNSPKKNQQLQFKWLCIQKMR